MNPAVSQPAAISPSAEAAIGANQHTAVSRGNGSTDSHVSAESLLRRVRLVEEAVRLADLGRTYEQRWTRVVLLGERKYGELLGRAENHGPATVARCDGSTSGARDDRYRARRVAAIPQEIFDAYLQMAKKPSRTGLLHRQRARRVAECHASASGAAS